MPSNRHLAPADTLLACSILQRLLSIVKSDSSIGPWHELISNMQLQLALIVQHRSWSK